MAINCQVLICRRFNNALTVVGKRKVHIKDHAFIWLKKQYLLDMDIPLYRKKNKFGDLIHWYVYDLDNGQVITQSERLKMDDGVMDLILQGKLIPQLVQQMGKSGIFDAAIIGYVIFAIMGAFVGLFIGTTFLGSG